eukprot:TRINITY_DN3971_c0_g2_i1.p1 TRINITY_DN3971_c0_g2~~TRINITY_DN3971_c0_g2_i1.p1  ORF type:complete len:628 (+),score=171.56 TRINITY_DN3971_c0_g2_i1:93-1976(+)
MRTRGCAVLVAAAVAAATPSSYDHCVELGPPGVEEARKFVVEWSVADDTLSIGFHARSLRGYVGVGFAAGGAGSEAQVLGGTPDGDTPCVRAMYDTKTLYDDFGDAFPNGPEVTNMHIASDALFSHVHVNRSLSIGTGADPTSESFHMSLLWAYRRASLVDGTCQDLTGVAAVTERTSFVLDLADSGADFTHPVAGGRKLFADGEPRCPPLPGTVTLAGTPLDAEGLMAGERHQSNRVALLLVGAGATSGDNLILQSGAAAPVYDASGGFIAIGEDGNNVCQASTETLFADWDGFTDPIGGIASYALTVMTEGSGGFDVMLLDSFNVGADSNASAFDISDLRLVKDTDMWVVVTAYNPAGRATSATGARVRMLDGTNPLNASLHIAADGDAQPAFWTDGDAIAGWWEGFTSYDRDAWDADASAWVAQQYEYAVGTVDGGNVNETAILSWTTTSAEAFTHAVALNHSSRVFFSVRTTNCAGRETYISTYDASDPAKNGIVVDLEAPVVGTVFDGATTFVDSAYYVATDPISASWAGFLDSPAGIDRYEWAIGTSADDNSDDYTNLLAWTDVGLSIVQDSGSTFGSSLLFSPWSRSVGDVIYIHVKAVDKAGHVTIVSSNGGALVAVAP